AWAVEDKPAALVDLATLTGAILVALGPWTAGLFSNNEQLASELLACARRAGEPLWRMPLPAEMEELIKSPVADLKNTGGRFGGSIEKQVSGRCRRVSRVSKSSLFTPSPWPWWSMLWPVRCRKRSA